MHYNKRHKKHSNKYSRKHSTKKTMSRRLPMIKKSIKNIGSTVETIALKSAPVVKTGVSKVFEILAKTANIGLKSLKKRSTYIKKGLKNKTKRST